MELMAGISLRSSSLKEVWKKIISERETHCSELDYLYERIEEYTEIIERHEKEKSMPNHEHEQRKKELLKLQLDLKIALEANLGLKKKLADRDEDLEKARSEICELTDNYKYVKESYEKTQKTLEQTTLKLVAAEDRCRHAEEDAEKHHGEIRHWKQRYSELETSKTELHTKFEHSRKEVQSFKQSNLLLKKERSEWLDRKEELEHEARKHKHREEEHTRKITEITESYEKEKKEVRELNEKVSKIKHEREELHKEVKTLKTRIEEADRRCADADEACRKWKRKYTECERDLVSVREELSIITIEHSESSETISRKTQEYKKLVHEHERLQEEHHTKCKEAAEAHRQLLVLEQSLRRSETTVTEKLELIHKHTERIERLDRDLHDACKAREDLSAEVSALAALKVELSLALTKLTAERDTWVEKHREITTRYEAIHRSWTEYQESGDDWQCEIEELKEGLAEAREQKENAIRMRVHADSERDECVRKYEGKCREVEGLQERLRRRRGGGGLGRMVGEESVLGEEDERTVSEV
tara:strand:- start:4627 stop:6222 length:1596 start_codon:yes stop_codon:yes gene_type:complete